MFEHQNGTGHAPANSHSKHQWHGRATAEHSAGTCLQALLDARIDYAKMAGRSLVKLRAVYYGGDAKNAWGLRREACVNVRDTVTMVE